METIRMGPIGRRRQNNETEWDEVGHNIIVSFDKTGVRSIQFGYVKNGALVIFKMYGASPVGYSSRIVRLKHDSEFVTGLSGEIYDVSDDSYKSKEARSSSLDSRFKIQGP